MAQDPANGVSWFLSVPAGDRDSLAAIRHWSHLKIAGDEDRLWVTGFSDEQIESLEVKTLLNKQIYRAREGKLFPKGSRLPEGPLPQVLWTPIARGLPLSLPAFNHNYFGIAEKLSLAIHPSESERPAAALLVSIPILAGWVSSAPAIRLQHLQWTIIDEKQALLVGTPVLPLQGEAFWQKEEFLFPVGYAPVPEGLLPFLAERINPKKRNRILWMRDGACLRLPKQAFQPLSIASFRNSFKP